MFDAIGSIFDKLTGKPTIEEPNKSIFKIEIPNIFEGKYIIEPFLFICAESSNDMLNFVIKSDKYKSYVELKTDGKPYGLFIKQYKYDNGIITSTDGTIDALYGKVPPQLGGNNNSSYRLVCGQRYFIDTHGNIIINMLNGIIAELSSKNVTYRTDLNTIEKIKAWTQFEDKKQKALVDNNNPPEIKVEAIAIDPSIIAQLEQIDILLKRKNNIEQLLKLL